MSTPKSKQIFTKLSIAIGSSLPIFAITVVLTFVASLSCVLFIFLSISNFQSFFISNWYYFCHFTPPQPLHLINTPLFYHIISRFSQVSLLKICVVLILRVSAQISPSCVLNSENYMLFLGGYFCALSLKINKKHIYCVSH